MTLSIRERLLAAITTAVDGQYRIGQPRDDVDFPICVVQEGDEVASNDAHGFSVIELPIVVAKGEKTTDSSPDALRAKGHELLASIIEDIFVDQTFGGLADDVEYTLGGILSEPGNRCIAEAQFTVRYQTVRGDPYSNS